ncbi:MAG: Holliday junction resolvase RuvX [Scrofimicrobium sp.]
MTLRSGVRLGIDVGEARIGVAASDAAASLALPVETIEAHPRSRAVKSVLRICRERNVVEVVVGLPKNMAGDEGPSAKKARLFAEEIAKRVSGVRVCLVDERLTTTQAQAKLHEAHIDTRRSRKIIDQMAAQIILEQALELERSSSLAPGEAVGETKWASEGLPGG